MTLPCDYIIIAQGKEWGLLPAYKLFMRVNGNSMLSADVNVEGTVGGSDLPKISGNGLVDDTRWATWYLQNREIGFPSDKEGLFDTMEELLVPFMTITSWLLQFARLHGNSDVAKKLQTAEQVNALFVDSTFLFHWGQLTGNYSLVSWSRTERMLNEEWKITQLQNRLVWTSPGSKRLG